MKAALHSVRKNVVIVPSINSSVGIMDMDIEIARDILALLEIGITLLFFVSVS